jgi:hypothetical protein
MFSIGSICRADGCVGTPARRFSTFAPLFTIHGKSRDKSDRLPAKTIDKTIPRTSRETSATFGSDYATQEHRDGSHIETR